MQNRPSVPINLQNAIFAYLLALIEGVSAYHRESCKQSRKRKRQMKVEELQGAKKRRLDEGTAVDQRDDNMDIEETTRALDASEKPIPAKPTILTHMVLGINAVTKRLEQQARQVRRTAVIPAADETMERLPPLACIFVCRAEVNPPILIEHFPPLVAACNSASGQQFVKLVPLPKDSEAKLAESLGIRSAAIIAIDVRPPHANHRPGADQIPKSQFPGLSELVARVESVPLLTASWLTPAATSAQLVPTHIKHLQTTAPKDMKATKEKRTQEKLAAKERRKGKKMAGTS
jgi:ribonuclease P/MRP protein subunit POP3